MRQADLACRTNNGYASIQHKDTESRGDKLKHIGQSEIAGASLHSMISLENMKRTAYLLLVLALGIVVFSTTPRLQAKNSTTFPARSASQLYSKYCVSCHGRDGKSQTTKGKNSHARDLTDGGWQDDVSDERVFNSIMNGRNVRGNMPAFSHKVNQQEADALVGFVRGLRK